MKGQMCVKMENCLTRGDSSDLVSVLRSEGLSSITLTRLDQLVTKDLCGLGFSRILVVLKSLEVLSENRDDLKMLVNHGLAVKKNSAPLLILTEEFYDYLLAIRTFNSILESLSREQRRPIQNDQNQSQILSRMAAAVLTVGDYELQVSLAEALCRLTPRKDREQRANQWFSSHDISSAFCDIRDKDFEVGFLWGSVHLLKQEVDHYSVELKADGCTGAQTVLCVRLNNPIMHHNSKGGSVQVSPSSANHSTRSYSRKKPQSKSHLKILPLSSPSSEEESCVMKEVFGPDRKRDSEGPPEEEAGPDLTCGITAAFNTFKTELEQHFTGFFQAEMTRLGLFCEEHLQRSV
ncbi:Synaptonemal complex protein 2-like [Collichthys lucidus]|uniref:Synaptonemal complex protein 2-like n=1 Tax=Collichthys lucidus TaxID=240159 RepID=A0A4U5VGC9_COLLU|nr:Synaptonemal complex protein 2-like [Collichthys lucidus]